MKKGDIIIVLGGTHTRSGVVNEHKILCEIIEVGKSELIPGKDQSMVTISKDDLRSSIPLKIVNILDTYDCDISSWEEVLDIIENKSWNSFVVLKRDILNENTSVKILEIYEKNNFKIKNEIINDLVR